MHILLWKREAIRKIMQWLAHESGQREPLPYVPAAPGPAAPQPEPERSEDTALEEAMRAADAWEEAAQREAARHLRERAWAGSVSGDVSIPGGMDCVDHALFEGNKGITSVTIPGTVKRIEDRAFAGCENLERVTLREGIEAIGDCVFDGCKKLRHVTYPDSVQECRGRAFYGSSLDAPVLNASGTLLVYCPASVAGREWAVPGTVKAIASQAFIECKELETLFLPEGLEAIEGMAFIGCGLREVTIPRSVRSIGARAFWRCEHLERATIESPGTEVGHAAFYGCAGLKEIRWGSPLAPDRLFRMKGQPFLEQRLDAPANLAHTARPRFWLLAARCARGDGDAMQSLAEWFGRWSRKPGASPFYARASNYWRYRAYRKGNAEAAGWMARYFADHPGEPLESILSENSEHRQGYYSFPLPGALLNDLGFPFFEPSRCYELKQREGEELVVAAAIAAFDGTDEDGFGAAYTMDWWFLDGNMQPIPGIPCIQCALRDTHGGTFARARAQAMEILRQRQGA